MSTIPRHQRLLAVLTAATTMLALTGCLADGDEPTAAAEGYDAILEAAADEGTVTWYTSIPEGVAQATVEAFEQEHDISVETIVLTSGLLTARYAGEMESGASPADVVTVADPVSSRTP